MSVGNCYGSTVMFDCIAMGLFNFCDFRPCEVSSERSGIPCTAWRLSEAVCFKGVSNHTHLIILAQGILCPENIKYSCTRDVKTMMDYQLDEINSVNRIKKHLNIWVTFDMFELNHGINL